MRSKNFFLVGDAGEREIRITATRLEQFREAFRLLFPTVKLDGGVRTNVVVFKNEASYAPFKPKRTDGSVDTAVAGYFQSGEDVNYITISAEGRPGSYDAVFHEYVHFLLDASIGRSDIPPWLGEGLAEYFETIQFPEGERVSLGSPPAGHLSLLRRSEFIPLEEFFETDNSALHSRGDAPRSLFYAQAWALTHYLLHVSRSGPLRLDDIIATLRNEGPAQPARTGFFGIPTATLAAKLREYVSQSSLSVRTTPLPVFAPAEMTATPLSSAQAEAYLGDLLYHTGRLEEAQDHLLTALKFDSDQSLANMSFGLVLAQQRKFAESKGYLEKAIRQDESNHLAYFNLAYALSRESMDENGNVSEFPIESEKKMRTALRRAIDLNPAFAESYRLLAFIDLVNDTNLNEAEDLLRKGLNVRPGDQNLNLVLAQVLLRKERYEESRAIAEKLAASAAGADVWAGAQSVLHTVDQYNAVTSARNAGDAALKTFGPLPPLILKRSSVSDSQIAAFEEDRQITNLNLLIERPRFGEKQVIGYLDKISCSDGKIRYSVRSGNGDFKLQSVGFGGIKMKVLTEGSSSFTLDCGAEFPKQLTVITFQANAAETSDMRGRLISLVFVPDYFRLKTPREMSKWRTVIVEDDGYLRTRRTARSHDQ